MKTITFYSYKGGTGRTLAVANLALFLARFGRRVFVLDFDLEAPGLHYKFHLNNSSCKEIRGVVDFVTSFRESKRVPEIYDYVQEIKGLPFETAGSIHLMPAGDAPSTSYSRNLAAIDWHDLFTPTKQPSPNSRIPAGVPLFLALKAQIEKSSYAPDFLLIDSRTGVTEIGGVAVRQMPDTIVCLAHSNPENLAGARKVLRNVRSAPPVEKHGQIELVVALARIPEMSLAEERNLLRSVQDYFNELSERPEENLDLDEVLPLHSDPDLQVVEALRFGACTTGNESILLRDYFKLFRKLRLDQDLEPDAKAVLETLAEADRKENIRPLLVSGRRLGGESALAPIEMKERLHKRSSPILKVVDPVYLKGITYGKFVNRVLERLRGSVFVPETETLPEKEVRWDLLAVHLREGILDFCSDVYYLTENRGYLVEIVQLGWCPTFTAYVRTASEIHQHLQRSQAYVPALSFQEQMVDLFTVFPEIAIGVLGDTPAASETNRLLSLHLGANQLISKGSESDLLTWLEEKDRIDRIAICDHVVVGRLNASLALLAPQGSTNGYSSDIEFRFSHQVPVGIVYPREDRAWRREISKAIAYSLTDLLATDSWSEEQDTLESVAHDFKVGGLDALGLDDLRSSLMLDLTFEEAIVWKKTMDAVIAKAGRHRFSQPPRKLAQ